MIDQSPYGTWVGREALDMAFSLAAFDQAVSILFTDTGVNWLRAFQQPNDIAQKSVAKNLSAAPIFGVEALYADAAACRRYGLTLDNMIEGVVMCESSSELLHQFAHAAFAG
ncbi:hypothetical protein LCGC14_1624960 [marine sediment metagenome]